MEWQSSQRMFHIHCRVEKCMHHLMEFQDISISQILLDGAYDFPERVNPVRLLNCEQIFHKSNDTPRP